MLETINTNIIDAEYKKFILKKHPCVMANTVFAMDSYQLKIYDDIESDAIILSVLSEIENYIKNYDFETNLFESLIFCFMSNQFETELDFETAMWNFLQRLHDDDNSEWDESVSPNPESSNFSFSLKGQAFYIIGMHPNSSRLARQAPYCTLVFNLHSQFEKLREMGTYQSVKNRIRRRDKKLQGSINPVLKDFGKSSESRQYSGRHVEDNWTCPFKPNLENL